jgi:hypothetical protein
MNYMSDPRIKFATTLSLIFRNSVSEFHPLSTTYHRLDWRPIFKCVSRTIAASLPSGIQPNKMRCRTRAGCLPLVRPTRDRPRSFVQELVDHAMHTIAIRYVITALLLLGGIQVKQERPPKWFLIRPSTLYKIYPYNFHFVMRFGMKK